MNSDDFFSNLQDFNTKYVEALNLMMKKHSSQNMNPFMDIMGVQKAYIDAITDFSNNPANFFQHNLDYAAKVSNLMFHFMGRMNGEVTEELYTTPKRDRRFKDKTWEESMYFNFVKQFYLMSSDWYRSLVDKLDVPESQKKLLEFYTEHMLNASSPTNFVNLNPEVINELVQTNGKNLIQGIENFLDDLKKSDGIPTITTAASELFQVGKNIASTDGKVIYQNDLMQLIYYKPQKQTKEIPILILPPWINKYYILDLSEENSYIKYLVDSGFSVFLVSWVNPGTELANKNFEDYLKEGVVDNIKFLKETQKIEKFNLVGYCLGGTLAACACSYFSGKNNPFVSATFLTTLLDFSNPGDLALFINEKTFNAMKDEINKKGYFCGKYMSYAFSLLRANELIWSFVVNNYLLGKKPMAFDLLYWNSDSTNLPAKMHSFYLENMYVKNNLIKKDGIELLGKTINLSDINIPTFFLSTIEDHIAPWDATYSGAKHIKEHGKSDVRFCLAGSGHIAGVINPPKNNKYSYHIHEKIEQSADEWLKASEEKNGSWWNYWKEWTEEKSGSLKEETYYDKFNKIEDAPGSYVKKLINY